MERDYFASPLTEDEVRAMGSLALAHVGDAVFELMVRVHLAAVGGKNGSLHRASVEMVNAAAQAGDMEKLLPFLTEEEAEVFRRGRNVKVHSVPKHARLGDYHAATGLEALFGYLYLLGRRERLSALFARIVEEN
ncbi:MAG: ribonuclease III [Oscillospiraceae bacterium]|nr:ribonuclease III [Oscillospiraceae bacterium]